jgi:hypothetical protein
MMSKNLTANLTTIDIIKALALIVMIVDHFGAYAYTALFSSVDALQSGDSVFWLRLIGRMGLPVWFFLIGYSSSRRIDLSFLLWALVTVLTSITVGAYIIPLSALFTLLAARVFLNLTIPFYKQSGETRFLVVVILTALIPWTYFLSEYGTLGFLIALIGYEVRQIRDSNGSVLSSAQKALMIYVTLLVCFVQMMIFNFTLIQNAVLYLGLAAVFYGLITVRFTEYPQFTSRLGRLPVSFIQLLGRRTLELYVLQYVCFIFLNWYLNPDSPVYGWFDWGWVLPGTNLW